MQKRLLLCLACLCLSFASPVQVQPAPAGPAGPADQAPPVATQPQKVLVTYNGASVLAQASV
ncbi:MAG: hypothetical protein II132_03150, partial [Desulfovibrio sp.]|nr:hypothetical protein [Desulfovibrio sp.]